MDCCNHYRYSPRASSEVVVGDVIIGGSAAIVVQSMGSVSVCDKVRVQSELEAIHQSGAALVRYTTQGIKEADALIEIRNQLRSEGKNIPLVADVHFRSEVAIKVASGVDKVRINPGNFSNEEQLFERFSHLIDICKKHNTAIRIGVNHGSLSQRMVERYGDSVEGMVESAMEYLRLSRKLDFNQVIVSMKSSNTSIMVSAYRELVKAMDNEGIDYPLHLGVTEAGNDIQGRSRSAIGIGALLSEGIGDTIRVSLTESATNEAPFARLIINHINNVVATSSGVKGFIPQKREGRYPAPLVMGEFSLDDDNIEIVEHSSFYHRRYMVEQLTSEQPSKLVVVKASYDMDRDSFIAALGVDFGAMLLDGYCDALHITNPQLDSDMVKEIVLDVLQASRRRISAPEYISCPSCGRTLFDIEKVLAEVKQRTTNLKNIKLAVMGCIVNGPGEMADADYGYVGAGVGKVTLYKAGQVYKRSIPEGEAINELIALLEEYNEFKV